MSFGEFFKFPAVMGNFILFSCMVKLSAGFQTKFEKNYFFRHTLYAALEKLHRFYQTKINKLFKVIAFNYLHFLYF